MGESSIDLTEAHKIAAAWVLDNGDSRVGIKGDTTVLAQAVCELRKDAARAVWLAEHLFQMVPEEIWRDAGGDDGQGHYEGLYRAEQVVQELKQLRERTAP